MPLDVETGIITWKIHLRSSPDQVFEAITTDTGRCRFWAETSRESDGVIHFSFPNGMTWDAEIIAHQEPHRFDLDYFGNRVSFQLSPDGDDGTDLTLEDHGLPESDRSEHEAGWVSVLLNLKSVLDHGADLRNHDPQRTWDHGYADN